MSEKSQSQFPIILRVLKNENSGSENKYLESQKLELKEYISKLKKEILSHLEVENSKNPKNSQIIENIRKLTELNIILIMDFLIGATYLEKLRNYNNVLMAFEEWELDSLKTGILELLEENSQAKKLEEQEL